jgi:hypothetical protein
VANAESAAIESIFSDDERASKHARAQYRAVCDERVLLVKAIDGMILRRRQVERAILQREMELATAEADVLKTAADLRSCIKARTLLPLVELEGGVIVQGGTTAGLYEEVPRARNRASAYLERLAQHDTETAAIKASLS